MITIDDLVYELLCIVYYFIDCVDMSILLAVDIVSFLVEVITEPGPPIHLMAVKIIFPVIQFQTCDIRSAEE
jgi:hypothetical protein